MAKTIPQLTDATTVNAADELIIQQAGITKRATISEAINNGIASQKGLTIEGTGYSFSTNGAVIHRLEDKLLVGAATEHGAAFPVTTTDWYGAFEQTRNYGALVIGAIDSAQTTAGSPVVTFTAGNGSPTAGTRVYGNGIPETAVIASVDSATQITLNVNATATATTTLISSDPTVFHPGSSYGTLRVLPTAHIPGLTTEPGVAGMFASRSETFTSAGTSCIGLMCSAVNNNATYATGAWALYLEAHAESDFPGAGTYGTEINVSSVRSSEVKANPFRPTASVGIQLGSGAGLSGAFAGKTQVNCGAAIQIVPNPTRWKTGISFRNRSIEGTDGYTGTGTALALATGHTIEWYNPAQNVVGRVFAIANLSANQAMEIRFTGIGTQFLGAGGTSGYITGGSGSSLVNWWNLAGATTANPPTLSASGTDTNVDLRLLGQGTGVLRFGTHAAVTTETVTGFITIKDAAGNTRKLAVVS